MSFLKHIFTWWHKQTIGTFINTLFYGKLIGKDEFGNKYYQNTTIILWWLRDLRNTPRPSNYLS